VYSASSTTGIKPAVTMSIGRAMHSRGVTQASDAAVVWLVQLLGPEYRVVGRREGQAPSVGLFSRRGPNSTFLPRRRYPRASEKLPAAMGLRGHRFDCTPLTEAPRVAARYMGRESAAGPHQWQANAGDVLTGVRSTRAVLEGSGRLALRTARAYQRRLPRLRMTADGGAGTIYYLMPGYKSIRRSTPRSTS
jgi:hypothetical protein